MAEIIPMLRINLDSTRLVEELKSIIVAVANTNPGKQVEIFKQIEMWLGETIVNIEKQHQPKQEPTKEGGPDGG